ncbi:MAG: hypothetical protein AAF986_08310 [Pseudomonadota bacterium]
MSPSVPLGRNDTLCYKVRSRSCASVIILTLETGISSVGVNLDIETPGSWREQILEFIQTRKPADENATDGATIAQKGLSQWKAAIEQVEKLNPTPIK